MKSTFSYQPCLDCVKCNQGAKGIGRASWVWLLHLCTCGVTLIIAHFMKCPRCNHTRFCNSHKPKGFES
ncbi:hypothetical protein BAQU_0397 [Bifidobacterium aquikefiri]|uniref:Uncharacterized protein n=1 Tax=Bifidobacterium aquikefiri TaxID=1653207 RepID=A0A261G962_9BIFI|nr:hypothetical protein BAQU_0397 [Bifidobacterium aquikefiri]